MTAAARLHDPVEHSSALVGLLVGAAIGVGIGLFIVATGGLGAGVVAAAVVGGAAATGAGIGEVVGSLDVVTDAVGGWETGGISSGSPNTKVNSRLSARATLDTVDCGGTPPSLLTPTHVGKHIAQGSGTVLINSQPAARVDDKIECGSKISKGSPNVIIGGPTAQTLEIDSEVPGYIHAIVAVVGIASAVVLAGPVVAVLGTLGSMGGGALAQWGAAQLGLSEDWQKIAGLAGSFLGGWGGARGGMRVNRSLARMPGQSRLQIDARQRVAHEFYTRNGSTFDPTLNGGKGGMRPLKPSEVNSHTRGIDFKRPVEVVEAPRQLGSYQTPGGRQGNYYAERQYSPNELGIGDYGWSKGGPVPKENWLYDIEPGTPALRSTSREIGDFWSYDGHTQQTTGGGTQYYLPDKGRATLVPGSGQTLSPAMQNTAPKPPGALPIPATAGAPPDVTPPPPVQQPWVRPVANAGTPVTVGGIGQNTNSAIEDYAP